MPISTRSSMAPIFCAAGLLFAAAVPAAGKGPDLDVGDDPSLGEKSAGLVLVEVADFQ